MNAELRRLQQRVARFEQDRLGRLSRGPEEAGAALMGGSERLSDLRVTIDHYQVRIRARILDAAAELVPERGATKFPPIAGGMYMAATIVSYPPHEVVPVEARERFAIELSRPNPRSNLEANRYRPHVIDHWVTEWVWDRICAMYLDSNDEDELRRIVADNTDELTQAKAFVEELRRKRDAAQRQNW